MQVVRHENVASDKGPVSGALFAELNKGFVRGWLGQNGFPIKCAERHEIEWVLKMNAGEAGEAWLVHTSGNGGHRPPLQDQGFAGTTGASGFGVAGTDGSGLGAGGPGSCFST